ncbi:MAG: LPS export ABC transporter periplasmic protein LptC [Candidatus Marinimicrobia bacterium]|nr:LPS export ABC transporter periplasmic protein LptC [Candidatus Neomarinimicrobiota bacterium]
MKKLILFLSLILIAGCSDISQNEKNTGVSANIPDQESWDAEIVLTRAGQRQALIKTRHLRKYNKKNIVLMDQGVTADFYDSLGHKSSRLTSEKARIIQSTNNLYASNNVVVESDSGVTLYTDSLKWVNETGMVSSEVPVKFITRQQDTLYGTSFRSNAKLENWTIEKPEGVTSREMEKIVKDE